MEKIRVVAALIERQGRYLITQRHEHAVLGLLWEFPGGKVEPGESDEQALVRELLYRLDAHGTIVEKVGERAHGYSDYEVALALYAVRLDESRPILPRRVRELRWVTSAELPEYRFPEADQATMDLLLGVER